MGAPHAAEEHGELAAGHGCRRRGRSSGPGRAGGSRRRPKRSASRARGGDAGRGPGPRAQERAGGEDGGRHAAPPFPSARSARNALGCRRGASEIRPEPEAWDQEGDPPDRRSRARKAAQESRECTAAPCTSPVGAGRGSTTRPLCRGGVAGVDPSSRGPRPTSAPRATTSAHPATVVAPAPAAASPPTPAATPVTTSSASRGHARPSRRRARAPRDGDPRRGTRARRSRDHPGGEHVRPDEDDQHREDEQLVGDRVEQRAERRGVRPRRRAMRPSNQSVAIADREQRPSPSSRVGKSQTKSTITTGTEAPGPPSADPRSSPVGRIRGTCRPSPPDPGRQPRRDRDPHLPDPARARDRVGRESYSEADRGSLHVARADEAYSLGPGRLRRELPRPASGSSAPLGRRARGGAPRLRLPRRERRLRPSGRGRRPRLDRPAAGGDGADGPKIAARRGCVPPECRSSPGRPSR